MATTFLNKADQWVTKVLSYPGIEKDTLMQRKIYWLASIAVTLMILSLTIAYHIIFPQLRILIYYGLFVALIYLQGVIYPLILPRYGVWLMFVNSVLVAVVTFITILKLGGIPYSGGLVIVGLGLVLFTLNFRERSHSLLIFIIYVITVILAGVLHPYLTVPPEMTTAVNVSLYVINLLWISGFALVFVMSFISQRVKVEQMETDRIKDLDDIKTRLYTNITHEFRTPLTMITGMTDLIRNNPERWLIEGSEKIDRNAEILLNLVNQMLDLSKLEAGAMPVTMIRSDINLYIRYIVELFRSVATTAKITLNYAPCEGQPVIDYDSDKLMQIISNLLSNALKFTQPCGKVEVSTALTGSGRFEIRVGDNGPGITEDYLPHIFDRFYRVPEGNIYTYPGSGLGLALTKELVKLFDGTITVESVFGEGTEFTVSLPVTCYAPLQEGPGLHELKGRILPFIPHIERIANCSQTQGKLRKEKPMLLIVEDNDDVVSYLMTLFEKDYDITIAVNGREGINEALEHVPDIILSDVMMPEMNGIEMLEKLKNDIRTSHIPIVLLTAKADIASRLEGLERGADAYIAKPFIKEELLVQIRTLVEQRKKLQERYASIGLLILPDDKNFHIEDSFMNKIREILISNLSDETFDVNSMCREMGMSRTQLYRKFRSLTDKTPNDYFLTLRLHKSKDLLMEQDITVTEAAYRVGFKNVSHFSRAFSREFGVSPRNVTK